jgi:NADH-quinone oxidoreductase subunit G
VEKSGTYLDWEGRARPFDQVLRLSGALPDGRVLHVLADEMDAPIALPDHSAARAEIGRLGSVTSHPAAPTVAPSAPPRPGAGQATLATWHWLLDDGSLQDGEPFLAGTAKRSRLHLSAATAAELGASPGDLVEVSSGRGSLVLPLLVADLPDRVVWLPTRSPDAAVRRDLAARAGTVVDLRLAPQPAPTPTKA